MTHLAAGIEFFLLKFPDFIAVSWNLRYDVEAVRK